jgi:hypothetical protein
VAGVFVLLGGFLAGSAAVAMAESQAEEYRVKAAFLLHFAELVEWPVDAAEEDQPITLCTLGDPFQGDLEAVVEGKKVGMRQVRVRHLNQTQEVHQIQELQGCQVLFVSSSEHTRLPLLLAKIKGPILTVGETEEFVKQGGMIALSLEGKKVRVDINLDASGRAGLKISSRLLLLARKVTGSAR